MYRLIITALTCLPMLGTPASADSILFDTTWSEQKFSLFSSNEYRLAGRSLDVESEGTVSLMWRALPQSEWDARAASWEWTVEQSVPATDLELKGYDDRNLSLYFLFLPEAEVIAAKDEGVRSYLEHPDARVLTYVWGGAYKRGEILESPYLGPRGRAIALRPSGIGSAREMVDLLADHQRAFGETPLSLVGLAVSADSDDTDTGIRARLSNLVLK